MSRFFAALHAFVWHRPRAAVALLAAASALSVLAATRLRFSSDISNVLPKDSEAVGAVVEVMDHFSFTGQMFLFFEKRDPAASEESAMRLADAVARRLQGRPGVAAVDWRISEEAERFFGTLVSESGPLLVPEEEMGAFEARLGTEGIREAVKRNRRRLEGVGVGPADVLTGRDPLDLTRDFFLKSFSAGRPQGRVDVSTGYYFSESRREMLMTVEGTKQPQDVEFSRQFVAQARQALEEARGEVPSAAGWDVSFLGGYPVALQNEAIIKSDMGLNILTSIPPVLLMLLISLRRWFGLAVGASALTLGILWTFGLAGLVYGHLTAVTVAFCALVAGMGIDFTIHMFHRYRWERSQGVEPGEASARTFAGTGPGAFVAMVTTIAAILCLWVSRFNGLREFATLVGLGLLLVFTATFLVIPLFTRRERVERDREIPGWALAVCWVLFVAYLVVSVQLFTALGLVIAATCLLLMTQRGTRLTIGVIVKRPRLTAAVAAALTLGSLAAMSRPPIGLPARETDMNNLRAEGDRLLVVENRMRAAYGSAIDPIMVLVRGSSEEEALEKAAAVTRALRAVPDSTHQSLTQILPPAAQQARQAARLEKLDVERIVADLDRALDAEGFEVAEFEGARRWLRGLLAARRPVRPQDVRDPFFRTLSRRFVSTDAAGTTRALVWFVPRSPLHVRAEREAAVNRLRDVAGAASPGAVLSGFPVVVKEIDDRIGPDIFWATVAGGVASVVLAWILFGSFRWMFVSIFPAVVGTAWFLACLKLMDMKMNYLNLIVFPLMAGLGTDNGLYLVERFRELKRRSTLETVETLWPSLTLTSLTTIVGFGSLAYSANRGMKSLGVAICVGMLCYLFASLLVLPPMLRWLEVPEKPPE